MPAIMPMLIVKSQTPSALFFNATLCGDITADRPASIPLPLNGSFFLICFPLSRGYLPVSCKLEVVNGTMETFSDTRARLSRWPGGIYELVFRHESLDKPAQENTPVSLARAQFGSQIATLYSDGRIHLAIEDITTDSLLFHHTLAKPEAVTSPELEFVHAAGGGAVFLWQDGICLAVALERTGGYTLLFEDEAEVSHTPDEITAIFSSGDTAGHQKKAVYTQTGESVEAGFFSRPRSYPKTRQQTARAFIEALELSQKEEAQDYLSDQLKQEIGPEDLAAFFGDHTTPETPPYATSPDAAHLGARAKNSETVRLFAFDIIETQDSEMPYKINNIREIE